MRGLSRVVVVHCCMLNLVGDLLMERLFLLGLRRVERELSRRFDVCNRDSLLRSRLVHWENDLLTLLQWRLRIWPRLRNWLSAISLHWYCSRSHGASHWRQPHYRFAKFSSLEAILGKVARGR